MRRAVAVAATAAGALCAASPAVADPMHDYAGSRTPAAVRARDAHGAHGKARAASLSGMIGPDVSMWDGCSLVWQLAAPRSAFAYAKATEGQSWNDPCFAINWVAMGTNGMARGAYDFARPRAPLSTATTEARHYVAVVRAEGGFHPALPPVLDVEANSGLNRVRLRTWIQRWINEVRRLTKREWITIYTGGWFWNPQVGFWAPAKTLLWASGYSTVTPWVAGFRSPDWWQYTDGHYGPLPHVTPGLPPGDHSLWRGTAARLRSLAHLPAKPAKPTTSTGSPGSTGPHGSPGSNGSPGSTGSTTPAP